MARPIFTITAHAGRSRQNIWAECGKNDYQSTLPFGVYLEIDTVSGRELRA
jgi:hypothetical protein